LGFETASGRVQILLEAVDRCSSELKKVRTEVDALGKEAMGVGGEVQALGQKTEVSMRKIVTGMSGVVTSAFALYGSYERVQDASIALDTAEKNLHRTETTIMSLRKRLNDLTAQGKTESEDYRIASEKLAVAEQTLEIQTDKLQRAKEDLNKSYLMAATSIIPGLITAGTSLKSVYIDLKKYTDLATGAQVALNAAAWAFPSAIIAGMVGVVAKSSWDYQQRLNALNEEQRKFFDEAIAMMPETERFGSAMYFTLLDAAEKYDEKLGNLHDGHLKLRKDIEELAPSVEAGLGPFESMLVSVMQSYHEFDLGLYKYTKEGVKSVTDLIREGLLGDAQRAIADFTSCAGGKHMAMVEDIERDIERLGKDEEEGADKIRLLTMDNLDKLYQTWVRFGKGREDLSLAEVQAYERYSDEEADVLRSLFGEHEDYLSEILTMTEEEKETEVAIWTKTNQEIKKKIDELTGWIKELKRAYVDLGTLTIPSGGEGKGTSYPGAAALSRGIAGARLGGLPKGEYLLSKHSPAVASPLIPGFGIMPKGWRPTPSPIGIPGFGGPRPISAMKERAAAPPPVSITANVSSTVNIAGPIEPGMIPAITEEVKRSSYEGTSSALRDSLRRKGVKGV